jgi:cell shape-determining protein MreC
MRNKSRFRITKGRLIALLLGLSVIGLLLPARYSGRLANLLQVIMPLQDGATRLADAAVDVVSPGPAAVSGEQFHELQEQHRSLEHLVASLSTQLDEQKRENAELTAIRRMGIGHQAKLIPARVVGEDVLAWRDSRLIDAGTLIGVADGGAVTTQSLLLEMAGDAQPVTGMTVLQGERLVGWISRASTYTARVRLLSDPETRMPVSIGRSDESGFKVIDAEFWLEGRGSGRIVVLEVDHKYIKQGLVRKGDLVMSQPDPPDLPVPLVIGRVVDLKPQSDNELLYTLTVESSLKSLRHVYVLDVPR